MEGRQGDKARGEAKPKNFNRDMATRGGKQGDKARGGKSGEAKPKYF